MSRTDGMPTLTERDLGALSSLLRRIVREEIERAFDDLLALVRENGGELAEHLRVPAAWSPALEPARPPPRVEDPVEAMELRKALRPVLDDPAAAGSADPLTRRPPG